MTRTGWWLRPGLLVLLCSLLMGCAHSVARPHSVALGEHQAAHTRLGQQARQALAVQNEPDGFALLANGHEAFAVRVGLIHQAQRSLDVQTYLLGDGRTTRLLLSRLLDAAERGVRVRLLIDDMGAIGHGERLAALASHANVAVRVYNPLSIGRDSLTTRVLASVIDPAQQHRRMHNKLWIVDNSVAIVGGRNLGDEYFDANDSRNFADLDLVTIGDVVPTLSRSFDLYWNHGLAQPIERYHAAADEAWRGLQAALNAWLEDNVAADYFISLRREPQHQPAWQAFHFGRAQAFWDAPGKLSRAGTPEWRTTLLGELVGVSQAERQLVLISAYFVPTACGVEHLVALADRQVAVSIITNSLESTDAAVVHGAYAPWRNTLLESGIELYELRPEQELGGVADGAEMQVPGASASALHIKAIRFDDQLFVGSFNADPRSVLWNSEVGVLVQSESLLETFDELVAIGRDPAISYQVVQDEQGRLAWRFEHQKRPVTLHEEPGNWWQHVNAWLGHRLGIERWL